MTHSSSDLSKDTYRLSMDARFAALEEMISVAQAKKENRQRIVKMNREPLPEQAA